MIRDKGVRDIDGILTIIGDGVGVTVKENGILVGVL